MSLAQALGRPLDGFRVVDFSAMIAGPYCTRWMADMGAEVLKIEPPEGDAMRGMAPLRDGHSSYFGQLNAGKRSVVLDLKKPDSLEAARRLADQADVLVENFRPGVMERLGLGFEVLRGRNPRLVYCSISGYGQTGPKSDRPSYAPIVQAASGYEMAQLSFQDDQSHPANSGLYPADILAACYALIAIQSALLQRSRTGQGQHLDVTLIESILSVMVFEFQEAQFPSPARKMLYLPMPCTDGFVVVAPITQKNFLSLCDALGHPQWKEDPRLAEPKARRNNWSLFMSLIRQWTSGRSGAECEAHLLAAGVPCSRYASITELLDDPQLRLRRSFSEVTDAAGRFLAPRLPFQMSAADLSLAPRVPALGEHSRVVFEERLGWPAGELQALLAG